MDPATALAITALGFAFIASVTSCFTCYRTERYIARTERETTTVEIDNSITDRKEPDGTTEHTRTQHIRIDDADVSTLTGRSTTVETGRQNDVASTLAGAASGGLSSLAGLTAVGSPATLALPSSHASGHKRTPVLPEEEEKAGGPVTDEDSNDGELVSASLAADPRSQDRHRSDTASVVSVVVDALADDGVVDTNELGEIMVTVLGGSKEPSDANVSDMADIV